jgi:hypothetical protein
MNQSLRLLTWIFIAALAALISYAAFRGYLNPDLLINFSNSFYC